MEQLTYLRRQNLRKLTDGALREPSGLAMDPSGRALWVVGDASTKAFRLELDAHGDTPLRLGERPVVELGRTDLEGVALRDELTLVAIQEHDPATGASVLVEHHLATGATRANPIAEMEGFAEVAGVFGGKRRNWGLEGITWDGDDQRWLVMKEGKPGMLLAVSADFGRLSVVCRFDKRAMGFVDAGSVDYSGMDYAGGGRLWIVSDKARSAFLFELATQQVVYRSPLTWTKKGKARRIEKAEGVVCDRARGRLHVVCDERAEIYTYALPDALRSGGPPGAG